MYILALDCLSNTEWFGLVFRDKSVYKFLIIHSVIYECPIWALDNIISSLFQKKIYLPKPTTCWITWCTDLYSSLVSEEPPEKPKTKTMKNMSEWSLYHWPSNINSEFELKKIIYIWRLCNVSKMFFTSFSYTIFTQYRREN